MGENRIVPFWTPAFAQCLMDYCVFWVQKSFLGNAYHLEFAHSSLVHHEMVQRGKQDRGVFTNSLLYLGMFCHFLKL